MAVYIADEQAGPVAATSGPVDIARLRRLAAHVLADQRVPEAMELSVLCVDAASMAELNERHMDVTGPTDVLAFPMDLPGETLPGEPPVLGDVVLCPAVARRQGAARGGDAGAELELLLVHGILHLLGHDHADEAERAEMFALTDRLLRDFRAGSRDGPAGEAS